MALCVASLASWLPMGAATAAPAPPQPYAPVLVGRAVSFDLSGFEPDFDPLYHVVISATLHDRRPAGVALPDAVLVLSSYLEVFKPDTTPLLPDLLHPDQTATSLGGFLQGKAALVNAAGRVAYRGSMLAEIFLDNTVHIVLRLYDARAGASAPPLQLRGIFTLYRGGTQRGWLRATGPLAPSALAAPRGPPVSWRTIVRGLSVSLPPMMGKPSKHPRATGGARCNVGTRLVACAAPHKQRQEQPATRSTAPQGGRSVNTVALGAAIVLAAVAILLWWQPRRGKRR